MRAGRSPSRPHGDRGCNGCNLRSLTFGRVLATSTNSRNDAAYMHLSERARTAALSRQAGGHWFEPSTAHLTKAPLIRGFRFLSGRPAGADRNRCDVRSAHNGARIPLRRRRRQPSRTRNTPSAFRRLTWNHRHRKEGRATSDRKGIAVLRHSTDGGKADVHRRWRRCADHHHLAAGLAPLDPVANGRARVEARDEASSPL